MNKKWYKKIKENKDYVSYVGPAELYNIMGILQSQLLIELGLNENHKLLDIIVYFIV